MNEDKTLYRNMVRAWVLAVEFGVADALHVSHRFGSLGKCFGVAGSSHVPRDDIDLSSEHFSADSVDVLEETDIDIFSESSVAIINSCSPARWDEGKLLSSASQDASQWSIDQYEEYAGRIVEDYMYEFFDNQYDINNRIFVKHVTTDASTSVETVQEISESNLKPKKYGWGPSHKYVWGHQENQTRMKTFRLKTEKSFSSYNGLTRCMVTKDEDKKVLSVAFLGTPSPAKQDFRASVKSWFNNTDCKEAYPTFWKLKDRDHEFVHRGLWIAYESVRDQLVEVLQKEECHEAFVNPEWQIVVTGASQGGAMAQIFIEDMHQGLNVVVKGESSAKSKFVVVPEDENSRWESIVQRMHLVTMASPCAFSIALADRFHSYALVTNLRVVIDIDPVPRLLSKNKWAHVEQHCTQWTGFYDSHGNFQWKKERCDSPRSHPKNTTMRQIMFSHFTASAIAHNSYKFIHRTADQRLPAAQRLPGKKLLDYYKKRK